MEVARALDFSPLPVPALSDDVLNQEPPAAPPTAAIKHKAVQQLSDGEESRHCDRALIRELKERVGTLTAQVAWREEVLTYVKQAYHRDVFNVNNHLARLRQRLLDELEARGTGSGAAAAEAAAILTPTELAGQWEPGALAPMESSASLAELVRLFCLRSDMTAVEGAELERLRRVELDHAALRARFEGLARASQTLVERHAVLTDSAAGLARRMDACEAARREALAERDRMADHVAEADRWRVFALSRLDDMALQLRAARTQAVHLEVAAAAASSTAAAATVASAAASTATAAPADQAWEREAYAAAAVGPSAGGDSDSCDSGGSGGSNAEYAAAKAKVRALRLRLRRGSLLQAEQRAALDRAAATAARGSGAALLLPGIGDTGRAAPGPPPRLVPAAARRRGPSESSSPPEQLPLPVAPTKSLTRTLSRAASGTGSRLGTAGSRAHQEVAADSIVNAAAVATTAQQQPTERPRSPVLLTQEQIDALTQRLAGGGPRRASLINAAAASGLRPPSAASSAGNDRQRRGSGGPPALMPSLATFGIGGAALMPGTHEALPAAGQRRSSAGSAHGGLRL